MRQTSLMAYAGVRPKLGRNQSIVLDALGDIYPASDKELASHLKWPINSITPRRGELVTKKQVVVAYVAKDRSGRTVTFWKPQNGGSDELADVD